MKSGNYLVRLEDQAPRIGCGCRRVEARVGWKWVVIRTLGRPVRAQRIRRTVWNEIARNARAI